MMLTFLWIRHSCLTHMHLLQSVPTPATTKCGVPITIWQDECPYSDKCQTFVCSENISWHPRRWLTWICLLLLLLLLLCLNCKWVFARWQWYYNKTRHTNRVANIRFWTLSIILSLSKNCPVYFSKHNISETGFCLSLQVKPTQLGPIDRTSPYLCSGSSSIDWAQLSRFCLKTETGSSLWNIVFWRISRTIFRKRQDNR
jgi:hypothetical protein